MLEFLTLICPLKNPTYAPEEVLSRNIKKIKETDYSGKTHFLTLTRKIKYLKALQLFGSQ